MTGDSRNPLQWLQYAEGDLTVGRRCLDPAKPYPTIACYHAQQCAEKALKSFLAGEGVDFARTHSLVYLVHLCGERDSSFSALMDVAASLQDYAARARYPSDEFEPPGTGEAEKALHGAKTIRDFVLRKTKVPPSKE